MVYRLMRLLALVAVGVGLLCETAAADSFEFLVQDDRAVVENYANLREPALDEMVRMRATVVRINVFYDDIRRREWANYDAAVSSIVAHGLVPQVTLTGLYQRIGPTRFAAFARKVARRYRGSVRRYAIWNEPNYGWMRKASGRTIEETYRRVYRAATRALPRTAEVYLGELSSERHPIRFLRRVLCLEKRPRCRSLVADKVAIHAYQMTSPPDETTPNAPVAAGLGSTQLYDQVLRTACHTGRLAKRDGGCPTIAITEFGYSTEARGGNRPQNISERERSDWAPEAMTEACRAPRVTQMAWYQLYESPQPPHWPGTWNTGIVELDGRRLPTFHALRDWTRENPACLKPADGTAPT